MAPSVSPVARAIVAHALAFGQTVMASCNPFYLDRAVFAPPGPIDPLCDGVPQPLF